MFVVALEIHSIEEKIKQLRAKEKDYRSLRKRFKGKSVREAIIGLTKEDPPTKKNCAEMNLLSYALSRYQHTKVPGTGILSQTLYKELK